MRSSESLAIERLEDEPAVAGDLLLDLHAQGSLVHPRHLPAVFLENPVRFAIDLELVPEVLAEGVDQPLLECGRGLLGRQKPAVEKGPHQPGGGSLQIFFGRRHNPCLITTEARLDNPSRPPIVQKSMIVVMKSGAAREQIEGVIAEVESLGYKSHPIYGVERTVIGCIGDERGKARLQALESMPGVEAVVPILKPFKLASREIHPLGSVIEVGRGVRVGGPELAVMAGPCSVESEAQILAAARAVKDAGAHILRGGAYKPRTSPYTFQGMEEDGLKLLARARDETGLPVVTEVVDPHDVDVVAEHADVLQVGARNVQNFALLKRLGKVRKPILLKRGMMTTLQEFLMAAEYILSEGNQNVILCERGIRTFETATRNTLDLNAIPVLKEWTHLPVIVDPSHGTGHWQYVTPMAFAGVAAGADGLMIEVHPDPAHALSDGGQSLKPQKFQALMDGLRKFAEAAGRTV